MGLDKAIQHGKEHRKPYHGAKSVDSTCRNHGGCPWCEGNRLHQYRKSDMIAKEKIKEVDFEED